jgi:hypothetical protein
MEHLLEGSISYMHLAENPGNNYMLCPSLEGTYNFIRELMADLSEVFNNPERIHLGGDEVYGQMKMRGLNKCPLCKSKDSSKLINEYLIRLAETAIKMGMIPEFWADEILSCPEYIDRFPRNTRFVDWNYDRMTFYSDTVGNVWGIEKIRGQETSSMEEKIDKKYYQMIPYIINENCTFNNFYGVDYIKSRGYEVVVASGVRSSGDCFEIPRIDRVINNVGTTEAFAERNGCDHLVTSWAVRLSHPETTWPGLMANESKYRYAADKHAGFIYGIDGNIINLLKEVGIGIQNIDIPTENKLRFERPFWDNYFGTIHTILQHGRYGEVTDALSIRIHSGKEALSLLQRMLLREEPNADELKHWINAIEKCVLCSEQVKVILDAYIERLNVGKLKQLYESNIELLKIFLDLWDDSVTDYSLEQEKEIKFLREIRVLERMIQK